MPWLTSLFWLLVVGALCAALPAAPHKISSQHLPNLLQIHPQVFSGGLPGGDAAFAELRRLGVKTLISVDGARPDVAGARRHGLRYVHLPHGYDGVPADRTRELAKAVHELPRPVYIHCHHGRHRSPAAASVACIAAGLLPKDDGLAALELAGTSPNYRGLYQSVREARRLDDAQLKRLVVEFRETVEVPPLAEAMVAMEHTHDDLKAIAAAGWRTAAEHPDLDPAHEALLLREHYTELLRSEAVGEETKDFQRLLHDAEQSATELEETLRTWHSVSPSSKPPTTLQRAFQRVTQDCANCHQKFRDTPLSEK